MVVNATQLASYSQAKELFRQHTSVTDGLPLHFCSSMVSGLLTTAASMPVDIVKTRLQNMKSVNGKPQYSVRRLGKGGEGGGRGQRARHWTRVALQCYRPAAQPDSPHHASVFVQGIADVLRQTVQKEGVLSLWRGAAWPPVAPCCGCPPPRLCLLTPFLPTPSPQASCRTTLAWARTRC